jgi:hypothetical protein
MSDDKSNRAPADRAHINVTEDYEVAYWTKELGVTANGLSDQVAKHGVVAADVWLVEQTLIRRNLHAIQKRSAASIF